MHQNSDHVSNKRPAPSPARKQSKLLTLLQHIQPAADDLLVVSSSLQTPRRKLLDTVLGVLELFELLFESRDIKLPCRSCISSSPSTSTAFTYRCRSSHRKRCRFGHFLLKLNFLFSRSCFSFFSNCTHHHKRAFGSICSRQLWPAIEGLFRGTFLFFSAVPPFQGQSKRETCTTLPRRIFPREERKQKRTLHF